MEKSGFGIGFFRFGAEEEVAGVKEKWWWNGNGGGGEVGM